MGSSTIGKGDTSRSGLRGDAKGGGYSMRGNNPQSNIAAKRNNLAGYLSIAPNPKVNPNKVAVEKPKNIPRTYVPAKFKVVAVKPPAKKPVVAVKKLAAKKPAPASARARTVASPKAMFNRPPATRFGVVTGKTTGTRVSGGGGYGGGGTRGSGSLSGQGSGTRSAGTSRTGGTRGNDPVRG